jgi:threonine dehydrogenase-like Zn-dependent dehydrogenase
MSKSTRTIRGVQTVQPNKMEVVDLPWPLPKMGEALIKVERAGICGSDFHLYTGHHPYATFPQIQGHEFCGIIEEFNDQYDGPLKVGDRVAIEPFISCGKCYPCRNNRPNCCKELKVMGAHIPGAFREYIAVNSNALYPVGDLDIDLAALVEPVSIGLQAVNRGFVGKGEFVVVFGAGAIGQAVLLSALDRGARVLVVDKIQSRLTLALQMGAEKVLNPDFVDVIAEINNWTYQDGPAIVFEATGVPAVFKQSVEIVASSGRVVILGISDRDVSLPIIDFTRKEITILGSRNNAGIFGEALELVKRNKERVRKMITHRFSLEELPQAIEFAMKNQADVHKVLIQIGGSE